MKRIAFLLMMVVVVWSLGYGQDIFKAVEEGDLEVVKTLISKDNSLVHSLDGTKRTPVHVAAANGKCDVLSYLLGVGGDGDAKNMAGTTPLHFAAFGGHLQCVDLLVKSGVTIDSLNRQVTTPLLLAVTKNHIDVVAFLLNNGANVDSLDREAGTPLHTAAQRGLVDITKLLLKHGADAAKLDANLRSAMYFAPFGGSMEIIQLLNQKGCDFRKPDRYGKTPLYNALTQGKEEISKWIMAQKVDMEKFRTIDGNTYLHAAVAGGKKILVKLVLEKGVVSNEKNAYGSTPYSMAKKKKDDPILDLLKDRNLTIVPNTIEPKGLYLGQVLPGNDPVIFAPGVITNQDSTDRDISFTSDLKTLYFTQNWKIKEMRMDGDKWTLPENIFEGKYLEAEAYLTPDEKKIFFISRRPKGGTGPAATWEIWTANRESPVPKMPELLGDPFSGCFYTTFTKSWRMYYTGVGNDIYYSQWKDGKFLKPVKLGPQINTPKGEYNSFIAPDESYLMFSSTGMKDHYGGGDIYIAFQQTDGSWGNAINMGPKVNSPAHDYCPSVSPDGKYFFFSSTRLGNRDDVYWMSADIIKNLKAKQ